MIYFYQIIKNKKELKKIPATTKGIKIELKKLSEIDPDSNFKSKKIGIVFNDNAIINDECTFDCFKLSLPMLKVIINRKFDINANVDFSLEERGLLIRDFGSPTVLSEIGRELVRSWNKNEIKVK